MVTQEFTKDAIRAAGPDVDLLVWARDWFKAKANITDEGGAEGSSGSGLSAEEKDNMKLLFQKYDADGNGVMDAGELGQFIKNDLGYNISEEELQKVLGVLDKDGSGQLEFEEVCQWWSDQLGS